MLGIPNQIYVESSFVVAERPIFIVWEYRQGLPKPLRVHTLHVHRDSALLSISYCVSMSRNKTGPSVKRCEPLLVDSP